MAFLRTKLHHFNFPSSEDPGYKAMVAQIDANSEGRGHWMHAIPSEKDYRAPGKPGEVEEVVIDTTHIFNNQWNESEGSGNRRLFDWYQAAVYVGNRKSDRCWGHWLEITPEMAKLRAETLKCGYCGKLYGPEHSPVPESGFCTACIGSPYLEQERLYMLRLTRVVDDKPRREWPPLTEDEANWLVPLYIEEQTLSSRRAEERARQKDREEIDKLVAEATKKAEALVRAAHAERDGKIWLWERGFKMDNVIYYNHSKQFGFGWRQPVSNDVRDKLLEMMSEFPYAYTIKCADGKTLERVHVEEEVEA